MRNHLREPLATAARLAVPLVIAGDIFHTWDNPAELVNYTIAWLRTYPQVKIFAIPGQHDLPNHNNEDLSKSSYWTLMAAGVIEDMEPGFGYTYEVVSREHQDGRRVRLWPFRWGSEVTPPTDKNWKKGADLHVAVVHRYIWMNDLTGYPGAPEDRHLKAYKFHPYNVAVFGDNHISFKTKVGPTTVFNCGGFVQRNIDQRNYRPVYGIIHSDGSVQVQDNAAAMNTKWADQSVARALKELTEAASPVAQVEAVRAFIESAKEFLFDFKDVVERFLKKTDLGKDVRRILEEAVR